MRLAFGLIGLLVTIGVIVMIMSTVLKKEQAVISAGNEAREEVKQIGGYSEDMTPAANSATIEEQQSPAGKLDALVVKDVVTGGALEKHFGLKAGDVIIEVNGMKVRETPGSDAELSKAWLIEAYQKKQPIVVVRDNKRVTLPQGRPTAATPTTPATGAPAPAPAAQPPTESSDPLQRQLDAIQKVPTH
jgi:hypothetical protein